MRLAGERKIDGTRVRVCVVTKTGRKNDGKLKEMVALQMILHGEEKKLDESSQRKSSTRL